LQQRHHHPTATTPHAPASQHSADLAFRTTVNSWFSVRVLRPKALPTNCLHVVPCG
jgi:hypothetical protein